VIGCLHESVQHLGQRHVIGQKPKESEENDEKDDGLKASLGGEPQRPLNFLFNLFEDSFHPIVIESGGSLDGVVFCLCHNGLVFLNVEQVDLPCQAEVGLELADAVDAGM